MPINHVFISLTKIIPDLLTVGTKRHEADSDDIAVVAERQQKRRSRAKSTKKAAVAAAED